MPNVFFVTQGQTYWFERRDGYIWAPQHSVNKKDIYNPYPPKFFWKNLKLVKTGDIIIHYAGVSNGGIKAISQAISDCFEDKITVELDQIAKAGIKGVGEWADDGWRVNCEYIDLQSSLYMTSFKGIIDNYKRPRYSAFNKNCEVCQGYLYELEEPIAYKFIEMAIIFNPYLKEHSFIVNLFESLKNSI